MKIISAFLSLAAVGITNTITFGAAYSPPNSWLGKSNAIYFYQKGASSYFLTNFFHLNPKKRVHSLTIDGKQWRSTEHYFQAQKFIDNKPIYNQILNANKSHDAFEIAQRNKQFVRADWNTRDQLRMALKDKVMIKALWAKFTQNPDLKKQLLATGNQVLIENSPTDTYWGCGASGDGKNQLGQMLMYIRYLLNNNLQPGPHNRYAPLGASSYH